MKNLISLLMSLMLVFSLWTTAVGNSEKTKQTKVDDTTNTKAGETKKAQKKSALEVHCGKCHKGDKDVKKINEAKGIKNADDMIKIVRKGEKSKLHAKITDKNLKAVSNELFPEKKSVEPKKDAVKTDVEKQPVKPKKKPEGC